MPEQQKYHVRVISDGGNAIEGLTLLPSNEFDHAINNPDALGICHLDFINANELVATIRIERSWIRAWMHQVPLKEPTVTPIRPSIMQ